MSYLGRRLKPVRVVVASHMIARLRFPEADSHCFQMPFAPDPRFAECRKISFSRLVFLEPLLQPLLKSRDLGLARRLMNKQLLPPKNSRPMLQICERSLI